MRTPLLDRVRGPMKRAGASEIIGNVSFQS
jgi:hypothetical protein